MSSWSGWQLGRAVLFLTAVGYVLLWAQLSLYHWAGAFKHWAMWDPVLATPFVAAAAARRAGAGRPLGVDRARPARRRDPRRAGRALPARPRGPALRSAASPSGTS